MEAELCILLCKIGFGAQPSDVGTLWGQPEGATSQCMQLLEADKFQPFDDTCVLALCKMPEQAACAPFGGHVRRLCEICLRQSLRVWSLRGFGRPVSLTGRQTGHGKPYLFCEEDRLAPCVQPCV